MMRGTLLTIATCDLIVGIAHSRHTVSRRGSNTEWGAEIVQNWRVLTTRTWISVIGNW